MENENLSAVTTDEAVEVTTNETDEDIVLADGDDGEVDTEFTDTDDTEEKAKVKEEESKNKPKQSKEKNREFAEKRRAEKSAKEESELNFIKEYIGTNPYTNEPIETMRDVKVYKTMKLIDKEGGDPLMDYHKYAGLEEQKALDSAKAKSESVAKDIAEFKSAYPNVDLNALQQDKEFEKFSSKLIGKAPLKDIYDAYISVKSTFKSDAEETAKQEMAKKLAKSQTDVGNLSTSGEAGAPKYTREQIKAMTPAEINKNWKDVEASYDYWNKHRK